jgi:signal transduction histidine kinase
VPLEVADPVLLQHVIPAVVSSERRLWPDVRFEVTIGDLDTVSGDDAYVGQIVRNLLSNAAKYGHEAGIVEVVAARERDASVVRVLDRGPGVAVDELDRLFDPFYRTKSAQRRASGAGIGLFVCRQLVEAMGGRIWATRRDGGGMEFGFQLRSFHDVGVTAAAAGSPNVAEGADRPAL